MIHHCHELCSSSSRILYQVLLLHIINVQDSRFPFTQDQFSTYYKCPYKDLISYLKLFEYGSVWKPKIWQSNRHTNFNKRLPSNIIINKNVYYSIFRVLVSLILHMIDFRLSWGLTEVDEISKNDNNQSHVSNRWKKTRHQCTKNMQHNSTSIRYYLYQKVLDQVYWKLKTFTSLN